MNWNFVKSNSGTIGFEIELQLVDAENYKLKRCRDNLISSVSSEFGAYIKKEYFQSCIEIASPVFSSINDFEDFLVKIFDELKVKASELGAKILAMGTHPFAKMSDVKPTVDERYERLREELQMVIDRFLIYGMHIHIGVPDEKMAVRLHNLFLKYLPFFVSLTSSSPFFEGKFTGLHSYRSLIFENLPRGGVPEYLHDFEAFKNSMNILYKLGYIENFNDVWWDVRIRPDYGTVELRVCDAVSEIDRIIAVVLIAMLLYRIAYDINVKDLYYPILLQNRWNAIRYSLNGFFIENGEQYVLKDYMVNFMEKYKSYMSEAEFKIVTSCLKEKTVSEKMVEKYNVSKSLLEVAKIGEI